MEEKEKLIFRIYYIFCFLFKFSFSGIVYSMFIFTILFGFIFPHLYWMVLVGTGIGVLFPILFSILDKKYIKNKIAIIKEKGVDM